MTVEESLEIVCSVLDQGRLTKVQEIVFRQTWEGASYQEIAISSGYGVGYITDVGSKLWQILSKAFGRKVTKNNLHGVLKHQYIAAQTLQPRSSVFVEKWQEESVEEFTASPRQNWGEAVDVSIFHGRTAELATLEKWIVQDQCRLVALFGMGGIGKTALAASSVEQVQKEFEYLIWRSLRNAPPFAGFTTELLLLISHRQEVDLPETLEDQISCLMECLRQHRCLLILDNGESILRSGERGGRYRSGYEGYGQLLRRVADERHRSCILLTSREKPIGLMAKEGETLPVRSLRLTGLQQVEVQKILEDKGLVVKEEESKKLIEYYTGNPLVLKIAATTIKSLFGGDTLKFLQRGTTIFGDIWELLEQQFDRLSPLEKQLMYWLANAGKHVTLDELLESIISTVSYREFLEALESLQQRSLIERRSNIFIQQPIIMKYVSERAISD